MVGHQTIRLIPGRHNSPERGACVMEVASMLAGEAFSDEPACVCPVIAEFLRTYNDEVDHDRRQDLFEYASLVVGTREGPRTERRRANMCRDWWIESSGRRGGVQHLLWKLPVSFAARDIEIAHRAARWAAASPTRHRAALALVERLCGRKPVRVAGDRVATAPRATIPA